ncbi:MAG: ATP-dependent Clp protease adapter ClpS [Sulfurovum sp.]|nr:ATP-dependent Clp protease adapter ClpS [Sulfurovaceae bacterium]
MPKIKEEIEVTEEIAPPSMYYVMLHNDDYTSMEFVVSILRTFFYKNQQEAEDIMIKIHKKGKAVCGLFSYEIARTKVYQVKTLAKQEDFPLLATIEKDV